MQEIKSISLFELNRLVRDLVYDGFPSAIWITAEISQMTENRSGHCYLELVEKSRDDDSIIASSRATIWASRYRIIKPYFETTTRQAFSAGINIMVSVKVEFHERYGLSLNITDIEPSFTLGEMARRKLEIIRKLEQDGVLRMNQGLHLPLVPQKIAVISSQTAAGYEDFINQLNNNPQGYIFYTRLFQANMQGSDTGRSIIAALDEIAAYEALFDAVVIIRGGGGKIDLSSFDDYDLAYYITQFPIPVIAGIGHERDESVVDIVAYTSCKTPTAVAEFLIQQADFFMSEIDELRQKIVDLSRNKLSRWKENLIYQLNRMKNSGGKLVSGEKSALKEMALRGSNATGRYIHIQQSGLNNLKARLKNYSGRFVDMSRQNLSNNIKNSRWVALDLINNHKSRLKLAGREADLQNPVRILKRGYSISIFNGKVLKDSGEIMPGDKIITRLSKGSFSSSVIISNKDKEDQEGQKK
jgi:exodeoxyribonuclease VII large subunit